MEISVSVTLLGRFAAYTRNLEAGRLRLPEGSNAAQAAGRLGIERKFVVILLINGRQGSPDDVLRDGDTVVFVPPAVGGG